VGSERTILPLTLDVWLVARLAVEIRDRLVGARIVALAGDASGLRISFYRRGGALTLRLAFDSDGPLVSLFDEDGAGNENVAGGWAGGVAPLLRGCSVETVQAVPDDRIMFLDVVSRSAFGVPARHRLVFELEPHKSNVLVLRPSEDDGWQILATAKEIISEGDARSIVVGESYEAPPPRASRRDEASVREAVDSADSQNEPRTLVRLLGEYDPTCSPPLGRETVERALANDDGRSLSERLLDEWANLRAEVQRASSDPFSSVYAWRKNDGYSVCHVVALTWPPGSPEIHPLLNDVCAAQLRASERKRRVPAANALRKRLNTMLDRCEAETVSLRNAEQRAKDADAYRIAGEAIYTYLADIPERAEEYETPEGLRVALEPTLTAKENAASYFKKFKKARSGLPRIAQRLIALQANRRYWEELLWELERAQSASPEDLRAVCEEITDALGPRRTGAGRTQARPARKSSPRTVELPGGAVAYVGKSPKDNERVTFSIAAPNDLWFHTRGIPGAHVVLKLGDPRDRPTDEQILTAAALAAGQSRAADAAKVEVDYTQRKHVRKQGGGRVGLVWYTDFKTVLVAPRKL
jgi:predicted ribosome quality control (RQC) complex YloA/Tae2 family protein